MNQHRIQRRVTAHAFTLIEMLVAVTVFALLLVGLSQLMSGAMLATTGGFRHMNADTQARMALDRIALDVAKMVRRSDVDYYFKKNPSPGNDQMAFYSEASGYYPSTSTSTQQGNVSLVGYRINSSNQLERLSKGLVWNGVTSGGTPMVFLPQTISGTWPTIAGSGTDADYQVIGEQIFRLEICFLVQNSSFNSGIATLSDTPYLPPDTTYNGLQDVVAIVATIAVLDSNSRASLTAAQIQAAANLLPHVTGTPTVAAPTPIPSPPSTVWETPVNSGLGLPPVAGTQVRVYQRYCYLNLVQ